MVKIDHILYQNLESKYSLLLQFLETGENKVAQGRKKGLLERLRCLLRHDTSSREEIEQEVQTLLDEGEEHGLISPQEGDMIQNIFDLKDTTAREVMIPRTDLVALSISGTIGDLINIVINDGHSRIPIYQDTVDNIIGILHVKELLKYWNVPDNTNIPEELIRPPYFIPENKKIGQLLKEMQSKRLHMAIVVDEYGGTTGAITFEDIIEEIVGEIWDEYDDTEEPIHEREDGSIEVDARKHVEDLKDFLPADIPHGHFDSIGGMVIHLLGRVPKVNEKVVIDGYEIIVLAATPRKIVKLLIRKIKPDKSDAKPTEDDT